MLVKYETMVYMYRTTYGTCCQLHFDYDPSYDNAYRARKNDARNILAVAGRFHFFFHLWNFFILVQTPSLE